MVTYLLRVVQIVRNVFTLGLGELGDWGWVNGQIWEAEQLIASCEQTMTTSCADMQKGQADLQGIQNEISNYQALYDRLDKYQHRVLAQQRLINPLRDQLNTLQNNALDVSRYFSVLAAKGITIQLGLSAPELAQTFLNLQQLMSVESPHELLWARPVVMRTTLGMIASSTNPVIVRIWIKGCTVWDAIQSIRGRHGVLTLAFVCLATSFCVLAGRWRR
jgi:hypothetical protein